MEYVLTTQDLCNAVKYSDGDFTVCMNEDGSIVFSNTAGSLSAVDVEKLFDRFYTVNSARRSTGLGLSIAKILVERMGGNTLLITRESCYRSRFPLRE